MVFLSIIWNTGEQNTFIILWLQFIFHCMALKILQHIYIPWIQFYKYSNHSNNTTVNNVLKNKLYHDYCKIKQ